MQALLTSKPTLLASLLAITLAPLPAQAADRIWKDGVTGNWSNSENWATGIVPVTTGADQASLITGGTTILNTDQGTAAALILGSADSVPEDQLASILQINDGGKLIVGSGSGSSIRAGSSVIINSGGVLNPTSILNIGTSLGSGTLLVNSGGHFNSTGFSGATSQLRIGVGGGTGTVTIDGGQISTRQTISLGYSNNSTVTMTLKNGGLYQGTSGRLFFGATTGGTLTGVTSTLNIGGETVAEAAGTIAGVDSLVGFGISGAGDNVNTLNFNHTSSRHEFVSTSTGAELIIKDKLTVNVKAGVTVLGGANTYTRGTTIGNGATLLANYTGSTSGASSTGAGSVVVQEGGTFGGIGNALGDITLSGTLKPGDYDYERATASFGVLDLKGDVTFTEDAILAIGINGTTRGGGAIGYSALDVSGDLTLDGTLQVNLFDDFTIAADQTLSFQIIGLLGSGTLAGAFDNYQFASSYQEFQLTWDKSEISSGWLHVSASAIPEPSTYTLIGAGLTLALFLRSRAAVKHRL